MASSTRVSTSKPVSVTSTTSTTTITTTAMTSTSHPAGCDGSCLDVKDPNDCRNADTVWEMCSSSNSWWHGQCRASCSKCESGLPPCTNPPPTDCDPQCTNTKST